jgi:hypothetical protein
MGQQGSVEEEGQEGEDEKRDGDAEREGNANGNGALDGDEDEDREGNGEGNINTTDGNTASSTSPNVTNPAPGRRVYQSADLHQTGQTTTPITTPDASTENREQVRRRSEGRPAPDYRSSNLDGASDIPDNGKPIQPPPEVIVTKEHEHDSEEDAEYDSEEDAEYSEDDSYDHIPYTAYGSLPTSPAPTGSGSAQQPGRRRRRGGGGRRRRGRRRRGKRGGSLGARFYGQKTRV